MAFNDFRCKHGPNHFAKNQQNQHNDRYFSLEIVISQAHSKCMLHMEIMSVRRTTICVFYFLKKSPFSNLTIFQTQIDKKNKLACIIRIALPTRLTRDTIIFFIFIEQ